MFHAWQGGRLPGADYERTCALLRRVFHAGGCDAGEGNADAWSKNPDFNECGRRDKCVI